MPKRFLFHFEESGLLVFFSFKLKFYVHSFSQVLLIFLVLDIYIFLTFKNVIDVYNIYALRTGSAGGSVDVIADLRVCGCVPLNAFPCLFSVSRLHTVTAARKSSAVLEIHQEV